MLLKCTFANSIDINVRPVSAQDVFFSTAVPPFCSPLVLSYVIFLAQLYDILCLSHIMFTIRNINVSCYNMIYVINTQEV